MNHELVDMCWDIFYSTVQVEMKGVAGFDSAHQGCYWPVNLALVDMWDSVMGTETVESFGETLEGFAETSEIDE